MKAVIYARYSSDSQREESIDGQLREKEREINNIVTTIQQGVASQALMKRLNEIKKQKEDIETAITKEQIKSPSYSMDEYRMALCNYRKLDITKTRR